MEDKKILKLIEEVVDTSLTKEVSEEEDRLIDPMGLKLLINALKENDLERAMLIVEILTI
jgi:hypothetical protein